jgi:hypothetical protein
VTHFGGEAADLISAQREGGAFPHIERHSREATQGSTRGHGHQQHVVVESSLRGECP